MRYGQKDGEKVYRSDYFPVSMRINSMNSPGTESQGDKGFVFIFLAVWAISIYAVAIIARVVIPDHLQGTHLHLVQYLFPLANFDSAYYFAIAQQGYLRSAVTARAFFPLFPILLSIWRLLFAWAPSSLQLPLAATSINLVLTGVMLWISVKLLRKDFMAPATVAAVILIYPYAFALISAYSEASLLCLTIGAFWAARNRKWWLAGLLAGLASAARLPGIILAPALFVEYMDQASWQLTKIKWSVCWLGLAPLGALGYAAYLQWWGGGISSYFKAYASGWPERKFNLDVLYPIVHIFVRAAHSPGVPLTHRVSYNDVISLGLIILAVSLLVSYWSRLRTSYRVFCILTILLPLFSSVLYGVGRYYLMLFPLYWLAGAAMVRDPRRMFIYVVPATLLSGLLVALFSTTYFVG